MNAVREWSLAICMAALVAALAQGLIPSGTMERIGKFILGVFMVCAVLLPAAHLVPQLTLALGSASAQEQQRQQEAALFGTVDAQLRQAAQASIESLVRAELARMELPCKNVLVKMNTNEDNSIVITKLVLTLPKEFGASCERAQQQLTKLLGLPTEVKADDG